MRVVRSTFYDPDTGRPHAAPPREVGLYPRGYRRSQPARRTLATPTALVPLPEAGSPYWKRQATALALGLLDDQLRRSRLASLIDLDVSVLGAPFDPRVHRPVPVSKTRVRQAFKVPKHLAPLVRSGKLHVENGRLVPAKPAARKPAGARR